VTKRDQRGADPHESLSILKHVHMTVRATTSNALHVDVALTLTVPIFSGGLAQCNSGKLQATDTQTPPRRWRL